VIEALRERDYEIVPDLLIEVPRTTCRSLEFHRAVDVIAAGPELAMRALDEFDIHADFSDP